MEKTIQGGKTNIVSKLCYTYRVQKKERPNL